eukprot:s6283_g4.t1
MRSPISCRTKGARITKYLQDSMYAGMLLMAACRGPLHTQELRLNASLYPTPLKAWAQGVLQDPELLAGAVLV